MQCSETNLLQRNKEAKLTEYWGGLTQEGNELATQRSSLMPIS